ncbi:MAG TPA: hypothetical protein VKZ48_01835 [Burkholderiales bacterium]|nr:hypothetical protein [Burkholderiales bacterium]
MKRLQVFGTIGGVLVLALLARHLWIEPMAIGDACRVADTPLWCDLRAMLILSFRYNGLGYAAVVLGVLSLFMHRMGIALAGASLGVAGLVLYCYDFAAVGLALSMLALARMTSPDGDVGGHQHGEREQQA